MLEIGTKVIYDGSEYVVEKSNGNDTYFIGNHDSFVELVSRDQLVVVYKGGFVCDCTNFPEPRYCPRCKKWAVPLHEEFTKETT